MSRALRIRPGVVEWRQFEEEVVAVDTRRAVYMAVNRSGSVLWPALLEGATREELINRLVQVYGVEMAGAEQDVDAFIEALDDQQLLEP
jgi:Coenzyme PQQ synthesis protein D (PqqD)